MSSGFPASWDGADPTAGRDVGCTTVVLSPSSAIVTTPNDTTAATTAPTIPPTNPARNRDDRCAVPGTGGGSCLGGASLGDVGGVTESGVVQLSSMRKHQTEDL